MPQPRCPVKHRWIRKGSTYIYITKFYAAIKKNGSYGICRKMDTTKHFLSYAEARLRIIYICVVNVFVGHKTKKGITRGEEEILKRVGNTAWYVSPKKAEGTTWM